MLIQWTPNGGLLPVTLGDDASKFACVLEQMGGAAVAQIEPLAGGPFKVSFPRGNVDGELVFNSSKTYASYAETFTQFKTEYGRLNQQGTLVLKEGAITLTFANAIVKGVQRMFGGPAGGARMAIRYTFNITTLT